MYALIALFVIIGFPASSWSMSQDSNNNNPDYSKLLAELRAFNLEIEADAQRFHEDTVRMQNECEELSKRNKKRKPEFTLDFPQAREGNFFINAIVNNRFCEVQDLVNHDLLLIQKSDRCGNQALHFAAAYSDHQILEFLLAKGSEPNAPNAKGITPAHYAALRANLYFVQLLENYGADLTVKTTECCSIITYATQAKISKKDLLAYLLVKGILVDEKDPKELGPICATFKTFSTESVDHKKIMLIHRR
jgi:ankyrin repeat protein